MFVHFWRLCLALGASPMGTFFAQSFFGFVIRKRVFRALDWLASSSGDKLMAQKPSFCQKFEFSKKATLATSVQLWPLVVSSQIEQESYSNPLKTREVFYIRFKKNFHNLFWPFWSNSPWLEDVLRIFLWCYPRIQRADIVAQSFIGSRTWIRVFRALDRLSSISGSKVRPERAKYFTDLLGQFRGFP